jgi:2',3'-cyclic-nucleotide 2'-phosphodiesterase (5'-nucleotidase family)
MFELMPFENRLSILTLSGEQVLELADQIADRRGQPVAGISFRIQEEGGERVARDVRVEGHSVDPAGRYRLATNDYMANGGEDFTPLQTPLEREDLPILIRDAFIEYVREKGVIREELEGRITGGIVR